MQKKKSSKTLEDTPMTISPMLVPSRKQRRVTADDYALPATMGAPPESEVKALDSCFRGVRSLLEHTLEDLTSEGIPAFLGYGVLWGLAQNGLIRAGVCSRADEMTRQWGEFTATEESERIETLNKLLEKYKIKKLFNRCAEMCGFFGGCFLFVDTGEDETRLADPLVLSDKTFTQGSLKGFRVIEPYNVTPGAYNASNPMKADYYKPNVWYILGRPVHSSRLICFAENDLPTALKPAYNFFGLPLAQKALDAVSHYTGCRESATRLLKKYSLTMFKTDMSDILNGGFGTELNKRIDYFVQNRDNDGVAVVDKDSEDIVIMTTSLSGVTDVVRQAMEYVAAVFNEPVTKMWGISPAGFSTGDSDLRNHYDNIKSLQEKIFYEPINRIGQILQMDEWQSISNDIVFKFNPLSEEDKTQVIQRNKLQAEIDALLLDNGIITPEEVRQRLITNPESGYNNLSEEMPAQEQETPLAPFDENEEESEQKEVIEK